MKNPFAGNKIRITQTQHNGHQALDMVGDDNWNVVATEDGVVTSSRIVTDKSDLTWTYGHYIKYKLADGTYILCAHLSERFVKVGDTIKAGQIIGVMGATGNANGAHLHIERRDVDGNNRLPVYEYLGIENTIGFKNFDTGFNLEKPSVTMRVYTEQGRWLPFVRDNNDYAGNIGKSIQGVQIGLDRGIIRYRVAPIGGDYYPWVENYGDGADGYAGVYGKNIDSLQVNCTVNGFNAVYRAHIFGGGWLPWVTEYGDGADGYAGIRGVKIDAIEVKIEQR